MRQDSPILVVLIGILTVFAGCSGSDSGSSLGSTATQAGNVNAGLSGYIWTANNGSRFNLETGALTKMSEGKVYPSRDGSEYIELNEEYRFEDDVGCFNIHGDVDQIKIIDTKSGVVQSSFDKVLSMYDPVRLSPDGQSIALFTADTEVCDNSFEEILTVYSRTGERIIYSLPGFVSFDWLPDNRLVFFVEVSEGKYELGVETTRHTLSYEVVANVENIGIPRDIRVSPDGKVLLIEAVTEFSQFLSGIRYREASIYQINVDGTGFKKLVGTSRNEQPIVNSPVWSPDGSSILVTENYTAGANTTFYGYDEITTIVADVSIIPVASDSVTYVLVADGMPTDLPPAQYSNSVKPVFAISNGKLSAVGFNPLYSHNWTPSQ